jgi:hypothetical protein
MGLSGKMSKLRIAISVSAVLSSFVVPLALGSGVAAASPAAPVAPSWEPDASAAPPYGNIVFYNSKGLEVTSGTNLNSPFAYAVGVTTADPGNTKATLNFYIPGSNGSAQPGNWTGIPETASTTFTPVPAGTPANLAALDPTGGPYYPVNNASAASITTYLTQITPPTGQYANITQVRLTESGPGGHIQPPGTYWETDIAYNTTASAITVDGTSVPANGWAQLFPLVKSSKTTLTSTLTSPQPAGTKIPLKATVSPKAAGQVQFYDGKKLLKTVNETSGVATFTDSRPPAAGTHSYKAIFTPTLGHETNANAKTATILKGSTSSVFTMVIS